MPSGCASLIFPSIFDLPHTYMSPDQPVKPILSFIKDIKKSPKQPTTVSLTTLSLCTILIFFLFSSASSGSNADNLTAYEALQQYGFPVGILPKGVVGYELDNSTGRFSAYLNGSCTFSIDSYELKYKSTITGKISTDKIKSLGGVKVKVLFLWFSVDEVVRDDDELEFSVGIASEDFPVSGFDESPTCGCGFDCETFERKEKRIKLSVPKLFSSS